MDSVIDSETREQQIGDLQKKWTDDERKTRRKLAEAKQIWLFETLLASAATTSYKEKPDLLASAS